MHALGAYRTILVAAAIGAAGCRFVSASAEPAPDDPVARATKQQPKPGEIIDEDLEPSRDLVCGPRCIRFVLQWFGRGTDADLVEITQKVQWPDLSKGTSFLAVKGYLEGKGVYCQAVRPSRFAALRWTEPVIVHLRPDTSGGLGHYAVWLPESTRTRVRLWIGLAGVREISAWRLAGEIQGGALICSALPIRDPGVALSWNPHALAGLWGIVVGLGLVGWAGWRLAASNRRQTECVDIPPAVSAGAVACFPLPRSEGDEEQ